MIIVRQILLAEIDDNKVAVSQNRIKTVSRLPVESFLELLEIIKQLVDHLFVGLKPNVSDLGGIIFGQTLPEY